MIQTITDIWRKRPIVGYFVSTLLTSSYRTKTFGFLWALLDLDYRNYRPNSNHGLEGIGALWAAAITFPFFREAAAWEAKAQERLEQWLADNLSPEGFHLEQSPSYHWFVLLRLAAIDRFLCANGRPLDDLSRAAGRAAQVWPYLLKPNGAVPTVGDSSPIAPANWRAMLERRWGRPLPSPFPFPAETGAIPCSDRAERGFLLVSKEAGYAVFASTHAPFGDPDAIYVLFRCRAFESPHCHYDALSFILYGLRRDWVVDSGYLSYHEWDPRRQYLRSPRAHSLVTAGTRDFRTRANECLEWGRTSEGDFVVSYHDLPAGRHTRWLLFTPPHQLTIVDQLHSARRRKVQWAQLFQLAPDLEVEIVSEAEAHLKAPDGARCIIRQSVPGRWRVARGEERPRLQGWFSESYGDWEPTTTLMFRPRPGEKTAESVLTLHPPPLTDSSTHAGPVT